MERQLPKREKREKTETIIYHQVGIIKNMLLWILQSIQTTVEAAIEHEHAGKLKFTCNHGNHEYIIAIDDMEVEHESKKAQTHLCMF